MKEFARRKRELVEPDMLIVAKITGILTCAASIPAAITARFSACQRIHFHDRRGDRRPRFHKLSTSTTPYDSLSFVPTLLALTGNLRDDNNPVPELWEKGFRKFPGHVVKELFPALPDRQKVDS